MEQERINEFTRKYRMLMREVKVRGLIVKNVLERRTNTRYRTSNIELAYFQIRKILEIIIFGSLLLNETEMRKVEKNIEKWWRTKKILEELNRINKKFYPMPITSKHTGDTPQGRKLYGSKELESGYLTKQDLIDLFDVSSEWIHTQNPLRGIRSDLSQQHYEGEISAISSHMGKIRLLLNEHILQPLGSDICFRTVMKVGDDENKDGTFGKVQVSVWEKYNETQI